MAFFCQKRTLRVPPPAALILETQTPETLTKMYKTRPRRVNKAAGGKKEFSSDRFFFQTEIFEGSRFC
jgi:hypothetical protein